MFKKSSSRNQKTKGVKIKHGLQILLLLGICFWLIYQVKYSHDKKRELNEKEAKTSAKDEISGAGKLGRKDLRRDEMATITNHAEDEEESREEIDERARNVVEDEDESREENDESRHDKEHGEETSKHEVEQGEEANKYEHDEGEDANEGVLEQEAGRHEEEEEHEEEENRNDDPEVVREGGEDETDEPDEEKTQGEVDREEEFIDEEKEREEGNDEKETEGDDREAKEGQAEDENVLEDEEHDGSENSHSRHEAREEHYKADDASSAVTHDTQTTLLDTEKLVSHDADDNSGSRKTGQESNSTISNQIGESQNNLRSNMQENQVAADKSENSSEVASEIKDHDDTKTGPANSSLLKPAVTAEAKAKDQEDAGVNSSEVNAGSSYNLTMNGVPIDGTENIFDSPQAQNQTSVDAHASDVSDQQNTRVEMANASTGNSSGGESDSTPSIPTAEKGNSSNFNGNQTSAVSDENNGSDMKVEAENVLKLPTMTKETVDHTDNETLDHRSEAGSSNTS